MLFPAGFFDEKIEIFGKDFKVYALIDGAKVLFENFPAELITALETSLEHDGKAQQALIDWGIPVSERLERYTFCHWGGFDHIADFASNELTAAEYHNHCGMRGNCKYEGICCTGLNLQNGRLTAREIEVARYIGLCYSDKLIASEMGISIETLRNHKNAIERKAGIHGKVAISLLAHDYELIQ